MSDFTSKSEEKRKLRGSSELITKDYPIVDYLEKMFGVDVWVCYEYRRRIDKTILHKTATIYEITHFGGDKKYLSKEEDRNNRTICFWFFGDRVVMAYPDRVGLLKFNWYCL